MDYCLWIMDQELRAVFGQYIAAWVFFFFFLDIFAKLVHIFFQLYLNFLQVLHVVNSLKITKTLIQSQQKWGIKTKLDARLAQRQKSRFIKLANNSTKEIRLLRGQGYAWVKATCSLLFSQRFLATNFVPRIFSAFKMARKAPWQKCEIFVDSKWW